MDRTLSRNGSRWTISAIEARDQVSQDVAYWQSRPAKERIDAVGDLLLLNLKTRGIHELPRLRRVLVRTQRG
jgi:hypothetical protein